MRLTYSTYLVILAILSACTTKDSILLPIEGDKDGDGKISLHLPEEPYKYSFDPNTTPGFVAGLQQVEITDAKAALGRVLFYDKHLSKDNLVSCASCHKQKLGFADDMALSKGIEGRKSQRNSTGFSNLLSKASFFWDGRTDKLREAVILPITDHNEMGMPSMQALVDKLNNTSLDYSYAHLFFEAYGSPDINSERIAAALASFVGAIPNMKSKWDKVIYGWTHFTVAEYQGLQHFKNFGCAGCHESYNVSGYGRNRASIGAFSDSKDMGYDGNTGEFFVPSLRNVALSAPYMHDGSLATLEEVLDFYRSEEFALASSDHRTGMIIKQYGREKKDPNHLTDKQAQEIIAYLKALTDHEVHTDKRFSNPFY